MKLSQILPVRERLHLEYTTRNDELPLSSRPSYKESLYPHTGTDVTLADPEIWSIVCRWQGLRLLYDIYCDPSIRSLYNRSVRLNWPIHESYEEEYALHRDEHCPEPSIGQNDVSRDASVRSSRILGYRRFYQALTTHWFAIEMLWLARVSVYETPQQRNKHFARVWRTWGHNSERTLQEKLDILEVYDFVWGFLGRKIFAEVPDIWSWLGEGEARFYFASDLPEAVNWALFVRMVLQYLRPPDIIKLSLSLVWNRSTSWTIHRPTYLRTLGFFDEQAGVCRHSGSMERLDWCFSEAILERDVLDSVFSNVPSEGGDSIPSALWEYVWRVYRRICWDKDAKGTVLFREESGSQILERMKDKVVPHLRRT